MNISLRSTAARSVGQQNLSRIRLRGWRNEGEASGRARVEVRRFLVIESTMTLRLVIVSAHSVRWLFYAGRSGAIIFTGHVIGSIGNLVKEFRRTAFETDGKIVTQRFLSTTESLSN